MKYSAVRVLFTCKSLDHHKKRVLIALFANKMETNNAYHYNYMYSTKNI